MPFTVIESKISDDYAEVYGPLMKYSFFMPVLDVGQPLGFKPYYQCFIQIFEVLN